MEEVDVKGEIREDSLRKMFINACNIISCIYSSRVHKIMVFDEEMKKKRNAIIKKQLFLLSYFHFATSSR